MNAVPAGNFFFLTENNANSTDIQSKTIDWLRFPLIIGVFFIHSENWNPDSLSHPFYYYSYNLVAEVLARICVPLFFLFSGYLFFISGKFDFSVYKQKIGKRVHSLFIPYIIWNLVMFGASIVINRIGLIKEYYPHTLKEFLLMFWDYNGTLPINFPLWFIRDLMIISLLSPLVYIFFKYLRWVGFVLLFAVWVLDVWPFITGLSSIGVIFFSTGAGFAILKQNVVFDMRKVRNLSFILYPLLALVDLLTKQASWNIHVHNLAIPAGIVCCVSLVSLALERGKLKTSKSLSNASFFLYVTHGIFVLKIAQRFFNFVISPHNGVGFTLVFFAVVITSAVSLYLLYLALNRVLPNLMKVVLGGR